jgi:hypothetical protein
LVLYHGAAPFTLSRHFGDEFTLTAEQQALLRPYLPDFTYLLYDLSDWRPPSEPPLVRQPTSNEVGADGWVGWIGRRAPHPP